MMKQHKWHKEIKAWADGAEIEYYDGETWNFCNGPIWDNVNGKFRIKPKSKKMQSVLNSPCLDVSVFNGELYIAADRLFLSGITGKFKIRLEVDDDETT